MPQHKRYVVICDDCPFGHEADLTERAEKRARDHFEETGHAVVAVELFAA